MCNPALIVMGAATVIGGVRKINAEKTANNEAAASLDYQAAVDRDNALAEAQQIRRVGRRNLGSTLAAIGASGVKIGEGSAADAERLVMQDTETDAAMAILNGERAARGLNSKAFTRRRAAREAVESGVIQIGSSLMSRGSGFMSAGG
jgi:hypothetical protein